MQSALEGLEGPYEGAICAIPLEDSLKRASDRKIEATVDRQDVWRAQTPQVFRRSALEQALADAENVNLETTDCSELLTRAGYAVKLVDGDPRNIKLTRPEDLELAELILKSRAGPEEDELYGP